MRGRTVTPIQSRLITNRVVTPDGCWMWERSARQGYGSIFVNGRTRAVHRVSYELYVGPIPLGLVLDHLCMNTLCFNPRHLEPVTSVENVARWHRAANIARGHGRCSRGHALVEENLYVTPSTGERRCWTCSRDQARAYARARYVRKTSRPYRRHVVQ
jgi:hypothetical protein